MSDSHEILTCVELATNPAPTHAVIWLHGLGADGNDFAGMVPELRLPASMSIRFIFPHAPVRPVSVNGGRPMRAWYDIFDADLSQGENMREDAHGIRQSQQCVQSLIARENARGVPTRHIVLAGFSQGCAMTLQTGLRLEESLAGLVGLSGYLPLADRLIDERHPANQHTPIFLAHGTQDPIIPLQRAQTSRQQLVDQGYDVDWHTYSMPHSVCPQEIADISEFLQRVLA